MEAVVKKPSDVTENPQLLPCSGLKSGLPDDDSAPQFCSWKHGKQKGISTLLLRSEQ